ncbi:hypothetical protein K501DRAFT_300315 [Backusella circina FSU 941]|nr:hypothetical protein K501DRAFT_300315 [Backusella circina FSU 941]
MAGEKYNEVKLNRNIKLKLEDIFDTLLQRKGDRTKAIGELAQPLSSSTHYDNKLILALISLIQKLPPHSLKPPLEKVNIRWSNLTVHDETAHYNPSLRRPDAIMTMINQNTFGENRGYGEVNTSQNNTNYDLTLDLVLIKTFSKQAIDLAAMEAVMGFQAVGNQVTFSVLVLANDGVYVACDIVSMYFPRSLPDIKLFLPMLDKLLFVLNIYDKCIPSSNLALPTEWKRQILDSPNFKHYVKLEVDIFAKFNIFAQFYVESGNVELIQKGSFKISDNIGDLVDLFYISQWIYSTTLVSLSVALITSVNETTDRPGQLSSA